MVDNQKISVLVVEDNLSWQEHYEEILDDVGYSVTLANSREDAIEKLKQGSFDVAVVDLSLPKNSNTRKDSPEHGLAVLDYISQLEPTPRVLVITGKERKLPVDIKVLEKGTAKREIILDNVNRLAAAKGVEEELWKVGGKLSKVALSLNGALKLTLERTKELTGAKIGHMLFPVGNELRIFVGTGKEPEGYQVPVDGSVTGEVFSTGQLVNLPNVEKEANYFPIVGNNIKSELAVPLLEGDKAIGVLNLESDKLHAFGELQENIAKTVADFIVVTLRNEKRKQELEATDRLLSEVLNSLEVQRSILEIGARQLDAQTGNLLLLNKNELVVETSYPENREEAPKVGTVYKLNDCVSGFSVTRGEVVNVGDVTEEPYKEVYKPLGKGMKSEIVAPMEVGGEIIGVINFESSKKAAFTKYDESLLSALAKQAAIALEKTRLYKELEEAKKREKMAAIGEVSGDLVHRLNSPISAIRANVQLIQLGCEDELKTNPYLVEKLHDIQEIADDAIDMVHNMKAKAREVVLEPVDIQRLVQTVLEEVDFPANVHLADKLSQYSTLPKVHATKQLSKVFLNLIANAFKAMPKGGKLKLDAYVINDNWLEVTVEDTGIGIPEEWKEEIFNILSVFATQGEHMGQGLGLWYSRAYVTACGGELPPPESEVGRGTKFTVRLPVFKQ